MASKSLFLIVPRKADADHPLAAAVLNGWTADRQPDVRPVTFDELAENPRLLAQARATWLIETGDVDENAVFEVEGAIEEAQLPALLTIDNETRRLGDATDGGMTIAPPDAPADAVRAVLSALWLQSRAIDDLRTEIRFLQAHQGGLCDQMDKIDEELRLAAQLQREFLPTELPRIDPVGFAVMYRPAGYVSGDIYDVLRLDESHIGFFLGDAVGHGVPAALMTMYIKRSLRSKEVDPDSPRGYRIIPPDEALARLNKDMCDQNTDGKVRFATACYGVINCKTMTVQIARAGHPFPIIMHADGSMDKPEPEGAMLGVFDEEVYETAEVQLREGDRMIVFSDGFEMAFPDASGDLEAATENYENEFRDLLNGPAEQAIGRLDAKLDQQAGSLNQQDDMTIVCLEVRCEAASGAVDSEIRAKAG